MSVLSVLSVLFSPECASLQSTSHVESQGVQLHVENVFREVNISQIVDAFHAFHATRQFTTVLHSVATDPCSHPGATYPLTPIPFL